MKKQSEEFKTNYFIGIIALLLLLLLLLSSVLFVQNKRLDRIESQFPENSLELEKLGQYEKYTYEQILLEEFSKQNEREIISLLDLESYLRDKEFGSFTRGKGFVEALRENTCYEEGTLIDSEDCKLLVFRFDQRAGIFLQILEVEKI